MLIQMYSQTIKVNPGGTGVIRFAEGRVFFELADTGGTLEVYIRSNEGLLTEEHQVKLFAGPSVGSCKCCGK